MVNQRIEWNGEQEFFLSGSNVKLKTMSEWKRFAQELHQRELLSDPQTVQPTFELLVQDHREKKTDINLQIKSITALSYDDLTAGNGAQEVDNTPENPVPAKSSDYDF